MRRVALLGADGMLGRAFRETLAARDIAFDAFTRATLDVTDAGAIARALDGRHDVVVNCTAYTNVDDAETNEPLAFAINADAVSLLAERAKDTGARLVHFSTDYVFDGQSTAPYAVDHPRAPINAYGRSKAAGELAIEASGAAHLIVRTSWLHAPWGKNFVLTIANLAKTRPTLRVVNDQHGRPTSVHTLAETTLDLVHAGADGVFHVTDGSACTWFDFATAIAAIANPSCVVEPCSTSEFPRPAARPTYSVLGLERTEALLGRAMTRWSDAMRSALAAAGTI